MEKEIYESLMNIFTKYCNTLSEEEKKLLDMALQAYKNQLFIIINRFKKMSNYKEASYKEIFMYFAVDKITRETIKRFYNTWLKYNRGELQDERYKFFSLLDMSSNEKFIDSIINICSILERHIGSFVTDNDIDLYRGFNAKQGTHLLSEGEYISTSVFKYSARDFMQHDFYYKTEDGTKRQADKYFAHIILKAGSPFAIFPNQNGQDEQYEVLLFTNSLDINFVREKITNNYYYNYVEQEYICSQKKDYDIEMNNNKRHI